MKDTFRTSGTTAKMDNDTSVSDVMIFPSLSSSFHSDDVTECHAVVQDSHKISCRRFTDDVGLLSRDLSRGSVLK